MTVHHRRHRHRHLHHLHHHFHHHHHHHSQGPLTAMTYLPDAALLVSAAADCTIRFWDATATPIPLTAPEGGSHVRLAPGVFGPMRPEWTSTNPKYVNMANTELCLTPHPATPAHAHPTPIYPASTLSGTSTA